MGVEGLGFQGEESHDAGADRPMVYLKNYILVFTIFTNNIWFY